MNDQERVDELREQFGVTEVQAWRLLAAERGEIPVDRVDIDRVHVSEQELAAALQRSYGLTPGHAAELAAAHHGRLPADVDRIPLVLPGPETVWALPS